MIFRPLATILSVPILILSCTWGNRQVSELEKQAERLLATNPDSALKVIDSALRDGDGSGASQAAQIRLLLMRQQAYAGQRVMDSVISTGVRIRRLAEQAGDSLSMAKSLLPVRGEVSIADQQALEPYLPGAARAFAAKGMKYEEAVIEGLTGAIATRKGRFSESMQHLYRARDIHEGLDSVKPLYAVYMNIGNNLSGMGDLRGSIGFYEKACEVAHRLNDSIRIATALMNEGVVRSDLSDFDSSRIRLNEALASLPVRGGDYARMQIEFNLATVMGRQGRTAEAESEFRKILAAANAMGDPVAIGIANNGLAGVMGVDGRVGPAIELLESTVRLFDSVGMGHYAIDYTKNLIGLYKKAGRFSEALDASQRLNALSDSLLSSDKQKAVKELEAKYNYERQEEEKKDLRAQLRWRNRLAAALSLAVLGLLGFGIVLRQRNRYQRKLTASYERLLEGYRMRRDAMDAGLPLPVATDGIEGPEDEEGETEDGAHHPGNRTEPEDDLQAEESRLLYGRIHRWFLEEKPYLDAGLKVDDLAQRFGVPTRRVTQALRLGAGQGYSDYVNRFRIAEATRIMDGLDADHLKIDVIAAQCGFGNRQHFRRVFEQVTGVNPSYYRSRSSKGRQE